MNRRKLTKGLSEHARLLLAAVVENTRDRDADEHERCLCVQYRRVGTWIEALGDHVLFDPDERATRGAIEALKNRGLICPPRTFKPSTDNFFRATEDGILAFEREIRAELEDSREAEQARLRAEDERLRAEDNIAVGHAYECVDDLGQPLSGTYTPVEFIGRREGGSALYLCRNDLGGLVHLRANQLVRRVPRCARPMAETYARGSMRYCQRQAGHEPPCSPFPDIQGSRGDGAGVGGAEEAKAAGDGLAPSGTDSAPLA